MKKLLCCVLLALSCNSCKFWNTPTPTPGSPPPPPTTWLECTGARVKDEAFKVLGEVANDLGSLDFDKALLDLIAKLPADIAWSAVACAVQQVTSQAHRASMAAPGDLAAGTREQNGRAWLAKYNYQATP